MKNTLFFILVLAITIPSPGQDVLTIQGRIAGFSNRYVYLYLASQFGQGPKLIDSVQLSGQYFYFKRPIKESVGYFLTINDTYGQFYFIWDVDLYISLDADNLEKSKVEESRVNELLNSFADTVEFAYNRRLREIPGEMIQAKKDRQSTKIQQLYWEQLGLTHRLNELTVSFIRLHKESWAGLFALLTYHKSLGRKKMFELLPIFSQTLQLSQVYSQLKVKVYDTSYMMMP